MIVSLIDADSTMPNLVLMKVSAYHKARGDTVQFGLQKSDLTYVSCIFSKNGPQVRGMVKMLDCPDIRIGGTGYDISAKLPDEIEHIMPDYSLYQVCSLCGRTGRCFCKGGERVPMWYSMGFTTRGCIRNCSFCIVREKEGYLVPWDKIEDFNDNKSVVMLLDNNLLAGDWKPVFEYIIDNDLTLWENGMDIRLMTPEIAGYLSNTKSYKGMWKFAFDNMGDEQAVLDGIDMLLSAGIRSRGMGFYVLVGYNTSIEEDIHRVKLLRGLNVLSYVMPYNDTRHNRTIMLLDRYTNNRFIYYGMTWEEYVNCNGHVGKQQLVVDENIKQCTFGECEKCGNI